MTSTPKRRWYQFSLRTLFIAITLVTLGTGAVWQLWPWWQERTLVRELRGRVLAAQNSDEAGEALSELLTPRRLQSLSNDSDTSIALKASFELVADREYGVKLSPENQRAFLRILEERTTLRPPDWWSKRLLDDYPFDDKVEFRYARIVDYKDEVGLFLDQRKLVIPNPEFAYIAETFSVHGRGHYYLAKIDSPHSYLARCDDPSFGLDLFCVESATGKVVWSTRVWEDWMVHPSVGISGDREQHNAQLEMTDRIIVVWGYGLLGDTYLEAFDRKTGRNLFRFSTVELDNVTAFDRRM